MSHRMGVEARDALFKHDADALRLAPLHVRVTHDGVMRNDKGEAVWNSNRALDFETGALVGKIADHAIVSTGLAEGDRSRFQHSAPRIASALLHGTLAIVSAEGRPFGAALRHYSVSEVFYFRAF